MGNGSSTGGMTPNTQRWSNSEDSSSSEQDEYEGQYFRPNYSHQPRPAPTYTPGRAAYSAPTRQPEPQYAYAPGEEPWRSKIQRQYETKADIQRLGRWAPGGGTVIVSKKEKQEMDAQKRRNKK